MEEKTITKKQKETVDKVLTYMGKLSVLTGILFIIGVPLSVFLRIWVGFALFIKLFLTSILSLFVSKVMAYIRDNIKESMDKLDLID